MRVRWLMVAGLVAMAACGSDNGEAGADVTVTFDGERCTVDGPDIVDPGEHTFLFLDEADRSGEMWVRQIVDGRTWEDAVEYMADQGGPGVYFNKPEWLIAVPQYAPEQQPGVGQRLYFHDLPADGVFSFTIGAEDEAGTTDEAIWLCGPIRT